MLDDSSRLVGLVPVLIKIDAANSLIEDYAACLEVRLEEGEVVENSCDDLGVLIMQLLVDNINRPAPSITHLLLKFDLDAPVEGTVLQPNCLKVILEMLEKVPNPHINFLLFEFGFQHFDTIGVATLPKRSGSQALRVSSLHQRAWLLKLLAIALHTGSGSSSAHLEACQSILSHLFGREVTEAANELFSSSTYPQDGLDYAGTSSISKSKALALLEILQFRSPDASMQLPQIASSRKYDSLVEDILGNRDTSVSGSIYYYSERGDRLIDLSSFSNKLWQKLHSGFPQMDSFTNVAELSEARETIQQLLKWGWKYNRNLEEQAAQLHISWLVSACRRISSLDNRSEILYRLLDASLSASASPDCSLKMAFVLTQVALTCIAKLRDDRFSFQGVLSSDTVTCLDVMMVKHLSTGACYSVLFKLVMAILRHESSESFRRRQYALLLSYFQYCQHMIALDVPTSVVQFLLLNEQDGEDLDIQKIDKEQADLARANFFVIKKEAQGILDLVIKDASQGSEFGKTISLYVLEALVFIDHERYILSQLQSRGFIRSCLGSISNISYQVLFSMGALEHIASCRAISFKGNMRRVDMKLQSDVGYSVQKQRTIITAVLRLVFALTSLVETSEFFEGRNKIVREVIEFIKGHQNLFDQLLREDFTQADDLLMEQIILAVGILSKVWPFEENDGYGFVQGLFDMMSNLFIFIVSPIKSISSQVGQVVQKGSELKLSQLRFSLTSYLYFLVTKNSLRLQVSDDSLDSSSKLRQPTLMLLASLLSHVTDSLERAAEKKSLLLHKIRDINELLRQDVDAIIKICDCQEYVTPSDNIHKRRYIAMVEMCQIVGNRDQLITLLLQLAEHVLNIILIRLQDRSVSSNERGSYGSKSHLQQDVTNLYSPFPVAAGDLVSHLLHIMVSPKELVAIVHSSLLGTSRPTPTQRIELTHAIRNSFSSIQNLLSFPPPKPSDRAQSLKLSDELHLNEIDSVRLLVSANQEITDEEDSKIESIFQEALDFIKHGEETGGKILVHCFEGRSRSATVVLAYLMLQKNLTLLEAWSKLRKVHRRAQPNDGFARILINLDRKCLSSSSLKLHLQKSHRKLSSGSVDSAMNMEIQKALEALKLSTGRGSSASPNSFQPNPGFEQVLELKKGLYLVLWARERYLWNEEDEEHKDTREKTWLQHFCHSYCFLPVTEGQLGYTSVNTHATPRKVTSLKAKIVAVSAVSKHTAVVSECGEVFTWRATSSFVCPQHPVLGGGVTDSGIEPRRVSEVLPTAFESASLSSIR
ncbi:unnamed protein product [Arabidopsis arenosa]|uniref:Uncharacterized protein n=1 Tax=Arabidopsis arenosa TaxID=38785 RepID=A0A8S2AJ57_ARAAE|nr:unnamed protein product [Arabidopsis arenosa]